MLPPATWLALLKYSPLPTSAQKDIKDSLAQAQSQPDPEQQKREAELKLENDKAQATIANQKALTQAKIDGMNAEAAARQSIEMNKAHAEALTTALTAPAA